MSKYICSARVDELRSYSKALISMAYSVELFMMEDILR